MQPENELTYEINGTTYVVSIHFSDGQEGIMDKISRLVQNDVHQLDTTGI